MVPQPVTCGSLVLDAEADGRVADHHVDLLERPFVQEQFEAFPRRELALLMLAVDRALTPGMQGFLAQPAQFFNSFFGSHPHPGIYWTNV